MKERKRIFLWAVIGAAVFFLLYGIQPLKVTDDRWIYNGYMEPDIIQHYAGWMLYRNSEWSWPLGRISSVLGNDCSTFLSYTDSIPLVAIILKIFSPILPVTFQYFGWYIFLCFVLQSVFAGKIASLFSDDDVFIELSCLLITLSPVLIERAFRHTALASHWLILAALYLYFKVKIQKADVERRTVLRGFVLLNALATGLHPYFVPMIMGIMCAFIAEKFVTEKSGKVRFELCLCFICSLIGIGAVGYVIGLFGSVSVVHGNNLGGYGFFSMNMNALINPVSLGYEDGLLPKWSLFLPVREQILGNYDGFNYLGIGVISALGGILVYSAVNAKKVFPQIVALVKNNWAIVLVLSGLCLYAWSNVITWDDKVVLTYEVPKILYPIYSTFKASSRYFYPVLYMIDIFILFFVSNIIVKNKKKILLLILLLQVLDFSKVFIAKRQIFSEKNISKEYQEHSEFLEEIDELSKAYSQALLFMPSLDPAQVYKLAYAAGKAGMKTNFNIMNRGNLDAINRKNDFLIQETIYSGEMQKETLYLFLEQKYAQMFKNCLNEKVGIRKIGGEYAGEFYLLEPTSKYEEVPGIERVMSERGTLVIESVDEFGDYNKISGWGFFEDMDTQNQEMYLVCSRKDEKDLVIPVRNIQRGDVADYFKNDNYKNSGFEIFISHELLRKVDNIQIMMVNESSVMYKKLEQ